MVGPEAPAGAVEEVMEGATEGTEAPEAPAAGVVEAAADILDTWKAAKSACGTQRSRGRRTRKPRGRR